MRIEKHMAVVAAFALANSAAAQTTTDVTAAATGPVHTVVAGEHYRAGSIHRFLLGADYRTLWTTPIQIRELDLRGFAGGLRPTRRVGGQQTLGLGLRGADGRDYTFRGLDKDPTEILPDELHGTFVDRLLQDQIASSLPGGSVAVSPILRAAGVLHSEPILVVMPNDSLLGEFRKDFGGLLGTFEVFPRAAGGAPGTFGAVEILNGEDMWKRLDESPATRPDSRAFLTARLVDILLGDWDRHRNQWRWARIPGNEKWQPIPEDRDQAFVRFEGLFISAGRLQQPQFVSFEEDYPGIDGLTWNGRDVDRRILADLEKPVWDEVARDMQSRITDDVLAEALARLPAAFQAREGEGIAKALRARRDALPEIADRFYRFLAEDVDIRATDQDEIATIAHADNGDMEVAVSLRDGSSAPYLHRLFHDPETEEVRIYLGGGNDSVVTSGPSGKFTVRAIGGDGVDGMDDSAGTQLRVSDDATVRVRRGDGTDVDTRPYTPPTPPEKAPWIPPRDWGRRTIFFPFIGGNTDVGVLFIANVQSEGYGFRKHPYADRHTFRLAYATGAGGFGGDYRGEFQHENSRASHALYVRGSGIDFLHFYGFGNDTQDSGDEDFFQVEQSLYRVEPSLSLPLGAKWFATLRANVTYAKTKLEGDHFIDTAPPYGAEDFLQAGAGAGVSFDSRDSENVTERGVHLVADGTVFPEVWDVAKTFSEVHGEVAFFQPVSILSTPVLALRAGGKKVWGTYPYHEAAYIGGGRSVRGIPSQRFAGDASVYGNAELRIPLTRIFIFVPGNLGIFGLADVGRVYLEGESSDTWHSGFGGGVWASFVSTANTASLSVAKGDEGTRVYVVAGLAF